MLLTVNGKEVRVPDGTTVAALLEQLGTDPARVAVERNEDVVPRKSWTACPLAEGDRVEIVTFVGGG